MDPHPVAIAFGLGNPVDAPVYVTRGAMGEIWRVATSTGAYAVKLLFPWDPPPPLPLDVRFQLEALDAGVPLPRPVLTSSGDAVVPIGERLVRVYEWLDVDAPATDPVGSELAAEAGRILGTIHSIGARLPVDDDVDGWFVEVPSHEVWTALVDRARGAEEATAWGGRLEEQLPLVAELSARVVRPAGPAIVCHRDFGVDNVVRVRGDARLHVLDWENCGPLQPDLDLACALLSWTHDAPTGEAFLDGYGATCPHDIDLSPASFTAAIATFVNFLKVMADQALDDPEHRPFAEKQVHGLLDGLPRLEARTRGDAL